MKTRMNIICILIFISIIAWFVYSIVSSGSAFLAGAKEGYNDASNESFVSGSEKAYMRTLYVDLHPRNYDIYNDTVYNEITGQWQPAQFMGGIAVKQPGYKESLAVQLLRPLLAFPVLGAFVMIFVMFVRLIYKINKSIIFHWTNVHKLRWMGVGMLVIFISMGIYQWMNYVTAKDNISLADYVISIENLFDFRLLISSLMMLLIAEIFAIGLRLQEEQELTI